MKKCLFILIIVSIQLSVYAQVDSVSISVRTEDESAFQKREKFKYLRRSMIDEPRLWKVTLQPYATTTSKNLAEQHLSNFWSSRSLYRYFTYGLSSRVAYEKKVGKVVSIMPELEMAYTFQGHGVMAALNFSARYYVGQKRAMKLGETGNNLLASYVEVRADGVLGFYSWTYQMYNGDNHRVRKKDIGFGPAMTFSYGMQKRVGKFGFFDVSAGAQLEIGGTPGKNFYVAPVPAIKLSWGFATPPGKFRVR